MEFDIYNISDLRSRNYFEDVLQSFYSKNYRASVLLLYSLVISDLYEKLVFMNENGLFKISGDLELIKKIISENESKYSQIEKNIYSIYKDKNILDKSTMDMLDYLIKIRDKCAHPVFVGESDYYSPSIDETRWLIRKCYEDIFTVDAYIKEPYSVLKNSLEQKDWNLYTKEVFGISVNEQELDYFNKYFEKRFFSKMTDKNYQKLFKSLIDLIYKKGDTEDSVKYQYTRFKLLDSLLSYLSRKGKLELLKHVYSWNYIENEAIHDEIPHEVDTCQNLTYMFELLSKYTIFIPELKSKNEILFNYLKQELDNNVWYIVKYYFVFYDNIENAIREKNESYSFYKIILNNCVDKMSDEFIVEILLKLFKKIPEYNGYDMASEMCEILNKIVENKKFNTNEIKVILEVMNNNRQIYDTSRNGSKTQFLRLSELGIDLNNYNNLKSKEGVEDV